MIEQVERRVISQCVKCPVRANNRDISELDASLFLIQPGITLWSHGNTACAYLFLSSEEASMSLNSPEMCTMP